MPIASYRTYDKTNDDADRNVLKDLTGNGHDIQLYNFAFAESSGYGKYATDFNSWYNGIGVNKSSNKFTVTTDVTSISCLYLFTDEINYDIPSFRIFISNSANKVKYRYYDSDGVRKDLNLIDGENILPISYVTLYQGAKTFIGFVLTDTNITGDIIVEQIPDYQGALVSDGVDDYGLCENFPILTKERGYTVCAIRKWIDYFHNLSCLVAKRSSVNPVNGAFNFELDIAAGKWRTDSFAAGNIIQSDETLSFTYQNSKVYNGEKINTGSGIDSDALGIFAMPVNPLTSKSKIALYALEIYDRDLTDEEIAKVKARMIAEYEEKTGNKYEEETV